MTDLETRIAEMKDARIRFNAALAAYDAARDAYDAACDRYHAAALVAQEKEQDA